MIRPVANPTLNFHTAAYCAGVAVAALLLGACAALPQAPADSPKSAVPPPAATPQAAAKPALVVPEQRNYTPFNYALLSGEDSYGEYFSLTTKISFSFDARGNVRMADQHENLIGADDDPANDTKCTEKGGGMNQRTTWFPDTAVFVRGGALQSVGVSGGKSAPLLAFAPDDDGSMMVDGPAAREIEYSWVPCVGRHRVDKGHRLNGFLPRDAMLAVKPGRGAAIRLGVPDNVVPHVLLRYQEGAMIPVPMRPVLVTVDVEARRMVVQYQTTFPVRPPLRVVELRAVLPEGKPAQDETPQRYRERTDALLNDLRNCPVPTQPMEPCASPNRRPDRRIFSL